MADHLEQTWFGAVVTDGDRPLGYIVNVVGDIPTAREAIASSARAKIQAICVSVQERLVPDS